MDNSLDCNSSGISALEGKNESKLPVPKELEEFFMKQILPTDISPLQKLYCTEILKVTKSF